MYVLGWTLGNPALPEYHRWLFAGDGAANSTGYANADFEASLDRFERAAAPDEARDALWGMERVVARDLPYLVLYHPNLIEGVPGRSRPVRGARGARRDTGPSRRARRPDPGLLTHDN